MRKHVAVITFSLQDEMWFAEKFRSLKEFRPCYYHWDREGNMCPEENVCVLRCATSLRLYREVPLVAESLPDKEILAVVYGLERKILNLRSLTNVRYLESSSSVRDFEFSLGKVFGGGEVLEREQVYLTGRERQVLQLLSVGLSTEEISRELGIGKSTVNAHKKHLFDKFRVHSTVSLIARSRAMMIHL